MLIGGGSSFRPAGTSGQGRRQEVNPSSHYVDGRSFRHLGGGHRLSCYLNYLLFSKIYPIFNERPEQLKSVKSCKFDLLIF